MDADNKAIGTGGCQLVVGASATAVKTGFCAYACKVRIDDTQIKSVTPGEVVDSDETAVTTETWENVALIAGTDYIPFSNPIVSITLNAADDSVMLYLQPLRKE